MVKLKSSVIVLFGLLIMGISSCSKKEEDKPAPQANLKPATQKPSAKPDIDKNVKNEPAKSTKSSGGASNSATKGGVKPNFSAPVANTTVNKVAGGNASFGRVAASSNTNIAGWVINTVMLYDDEDTTALVLYTTNPALVDSDNDGTPDASDSDDDNDGTPDASDSDDDNDGVTDEDDDEDDDNDGIADIDDLDDDNDGVSDDDEEDSSDTDSDDDGIADNEDDDDDGDGIDDDGDVDDDGDGIDDNDEDDFDSLSDDSAFDFCLFFFSSGEYMVYDPSEGDDAWDWGYWYYAQIQADEFLCTDLGDVDDESVFFVDSESDPNKFDLGYYDLDSGLYLIISFDKLTLS